MEIAEFAADAKMMLPEISAADLQLGYSGLRPKLKAPGEKGVADFVIEADREVPRVIQLVGIESPGLTAATAIAEHVAGMVAEVIGD
jgi:L-2-hydroxyglutarate oxidase LhgO